VFVKSAEPGQARPRDEQYAKTMAPVTAIIGYDMAFFTRWRTCPHVEATRG
jgi:hypothetical protein